MIHTNVFGRKHELRRSPWANTNQICHPPLLSLVTPTPQSTFRISRPELFKHDGGLSRGIACNSPRATCDENKRSNLPPSFALRSSPHRCLHDGAVAGGHRVNRSEKRGWLQVAGVRVVMTRQQKTNCSCGHNREE